MELLNEALREFYKNDSKLFATGSSEMSMAFRLGIYLNKNILRLPCYYSLDSEYNKCKTSEKYVFEECKECSNYDICYMQLKESQTTARPDLIIHKRGENGNLHDNLCCIEIKKEGNSVEHDINKLRYMTCPKGHYKYEYGVLIVLAPNGAKIQMFKNGKKTAKPYGFREHFSNI